ncbi:hypothetical protein BKA70DRAFT_1449660 [Coprinopsis sp. MPI-PUGE-AT-0042]|nr:hypothetical protein BKA70DRAFT_1449660 [Coprinopsis sp. MPI-PUGE-AT-0042]
MSLQYNMQHGPNATIPILNFDVMERIASFLAIFPLNRAMFSFRLASQCTSYAGQRYLFRSITLAEMPHNSRRVSVHHRIQKLLEFTVMHPTVISDIRHLYLSTEADQSWLASDPLEQLVTQIASNPDSSIESLHVIGCDAKAPAIGLHLGCAINPLAGKIKRMVLDNVVGIPYFFLGDFTCLEHLELRGVNSDGDNTQYGQKPKVKTLRCFADATVRQDDPSSGKEGSVLAQVSVDLVEKVHMDVAQFQDLYRSLEPNVGCPSLREFVLNVSQLCYAKSQLTLPSVTFPQVDQLILQVLFKKQEEVEHIQDPLAAIASGLAAFRGADNLTVRIDLIARGVQHDRFYNLDWDILDLALVQFARKHHTTHVLFRFLRQQELRSDNLMFSCVSKRYLHNRMPLSTSVSTIEFETLPVADVRLASVEHIAVNVTGLSEHSNDLSNDLLYIRLPNVSNILLEASCDDWVFVGCKDDPIRDLAKAIRAMTVASTVHIQLDCIIHGLSYCSFANFAWRNLDNALSRFSERHSEVFVNIRFIRQKATGNSPDTIAFAPAQFLCQLLPVSYSIETAHIISSPPTVIPEFILYEE